MVFIFCGIAVVQAAPPAPASTDSITSTLGKAGEGMGASAAGGVPNKDLPTIVGAAIKVILVLLGIILLVLVIYSGIMWMTAGGNPERVTKAKDMLSQAVIGLGIALAAYAITYFVVDKLTVATGVSALINSIFI